MGRGGGSLWQGRAFDIEDDEEKRHVSLFCMRGKLLND